MTGLHHTHTHLCSNSQVLHFLPCHLNCTLICHASIFSHIFYQSRYVHADITAALVLIQLAGIITATAAFAVNVSVENISGFKFWATLTLISKGHVALSFLVYVCINTVLVFGAVAVTAYVGPAAAGSGIAEVKVSVSCACHISHIT